MRDPKGLAAGAAIYDAMRLTTNFIAGATGQPSIDEQLQAGMTKLGVAQPDTPLERVIQTGAEAGSQALSFGGVGRALATRGAGPTRQVISEMLQADMPAQIAGNVTAGMAAQATKEAGGGEFAQLAAGTLGGIPGSTITKQFMPRSGITPTTGSAQQYAAIKPKLSPAELDEAAKSAGVSLPTSGIFPPEGRIGAMATTVGANIPVLGTGAKMRAGQEGRRQLVRAIVGEAADEKTVDMIADVSADLLAKRSSDIVEHKGMVNKVLGSVGGFVGVGHTTQVIDDQIKSLMKLKDPALNPVIKLLRSKKTAIQRQTASNLETHRGMLGQNAFAESDISDAVKKVAKEHLRPVYDALQEDIGAAVKQTQGPLEFVKYKNAQKQLGRMMGELEDTTLESALNKGGVTPQIAKKLIFSAEPATLARLNRGLTPQGKETVRKVLLADAFEQAVKGEPNSPPDPEIFAKIMRKHQANYEKFVTPGEAQRAESLLQVIEKSEYLGKLSKDPGVTTGVVSTLGFGALAKMGGAKLAGAVLAAAGPLARAYESNAMKVLLTKIPKLKKGSQEEAETAKRVLTLLNTAALEQTEAEKKAKKKKESYYGY
jgi:hypothetical protein